MSLIPVRIESNVFNDFYFPYLNDSHRTLIFYGGAGSGKSFFVAQRMIVKWLEGGHNFLVVRKTGRSNRNSTFALIKQVLEIWKLPKEWYSVNRTELTITNNINRSQIAFAGLDDVEKLKSVTFESGVLTDVWIEEASEVSENDYTQLNLRLRGSAKVPFQIVLSFNPVSALSWLKKRFFDRENRNTLAVKSTYLNNRFIDDEYKQSIEDLQYTNPEFYKIYALGEWGVIGDLIYTNFKILDFDTTRFNNVFAGLDFGFNHPSAFLKVAEKDNNIYILDELYQSGLTNTELIQRITEQFGKDLRICADSAEPDRILEFQRAGFRVTPSVKGKDSVKFGIDWLKSRTIYIHSKNCPNTAGEISQYSYRKDKDGNVTEEPVTFKDDAMAALRYSIEHLRHERAKIQYTSFGQRTGW